MSVNATLPASKLSINSQTFANIQSNALITTYGAGTTFTDQHWRAADVTFHPIMGLAEQWCTMLYQSTVYHVIPACYTINGAPCYTINGAPCYTSML